MDLDEYIKKLDECPRKIVKDKNSKGEERDIPMLTNEYGLHDNKISINGNYDRIDAFFTTNDNYELKNTIKDHNNITKLFEFNGGKLALFNYLPRNFGSDSFSENTKQKLSNYNIGLQLNIDNSWTKPENAIPLLKDIANYAKKDSADICLEAHPWKLDFAPKRTSKEFWQMVEDNLIYSSK